MAISIDAPLEPVRGFAGAISGSLTIDYKKPENSTGKIVVDSNAIQVGNPGMTHALQQPWCLDVQKYPTVEFEVTKVEKVKIGKDDTGKARITGNFTLHGVTKPLTVDANVHLLPGKLKTRGGIAKDGDLVQIFSKFSIKRSDFGIAKDLSTDMIGDTINIDIAATGISIK